MRSPPIRRYSEADEAFFRNLTFCEEDRHLVTSAPWRGGYRWFRSTNVAPLEQWRRRKTDHHQQITA
jgi:hypothetical protein